MTISVAGPGGYTASIISGAGGAYELHGHTCRYGHRIGHIAIRIRSCRSSGGFCGDPGQSGQVVEQNFVLAHLLSTVVGTVVADCPAPGTPVESVVVEVRDVVTNTVVGMATSGPDGHYAIADLDAGAYVVSATVPTGYNLESNHIPLTVDWGQTATVDFALECQQPPVVTADLLDTTVDEGQVAANTGTVNDPEVIRSH